jgi:hypothetical protein
MVRFQTAALRIVIARLRKSRETFLMPINIVRLNAGFVPRAVALRTL